MRDAQRKMTWFALAGMLLYPATVMTTELMNLHQAATILGDMAAVYFVSVAGIVAAFFGAQAWSGKNNTTTVFNRDGVVMSPNLESTEDLVTGQLYYTFELGISYPKKRNL